MDPSCENNLLQLLDGVCKIDSSRPACKKKFEIVTYETSASHIGSNGCRIRSFIVAAIHADSYAESGNDCYCRSAPYLHGVDSIPRILYCSNFSVDLFVGKSELVQNLELASSVFDGLKCHGGLAFLPTIKSHL